MSSSQTSTSNAGTAERAPRVTIGMPVYNGQRFVRATLDSLLAQTFTDFELLICDNASTDSTEQICREYAARDPRVRYVRNERNIGPAPNYNKCFELARGELFKWSAADDTIAPDFLARCVAELDRDPSLAGCYTRTTEIDADGKELYKHTTVLDLDSPSVLRRLASYTFVNHRRHAAPELWAVWRADVLRRWKPLKGSFPSADRLVILRAALHGPVRRIEEHLFFNRSHGQRSQTYLDKMKVRPGSRLVKYVGCGPLPSYEWWDANMKGRIVFPEWRWVWEYVKAVHDTPMPAGSKLASYAILAGLAVKFIPRLGRDVVLAAEILFNRATGLAPKPQAPASGNPVAGSPAVRN